MVRKELVKKAAKFITDMSGKRVPNTNVIPTQNAIRQFLMNEKGLTSTEYLEALNIAGNGALLNSI